MPLSASSLFHFTKKKDFLYGILDETFRLSYCREDFLIGGERYSIRVPMVSFCDIPLSEIKNHIDSYGPYGLGLSKEWLNTKISILFYMLNKIRSYREAMRGYSGASS